MHHQDYQKEFDRAHAAYKAAAQKEFAALLVAAKTTVYVRDSYREDWNFGYDCACKPVYCPSAASKVLAAYSARTGKFLFSKGEAKKMAAKVWKGVYGTNA